jgi:hypothetical protein
MAQVVAHCPSRGPEFIPQHYQKKVFAICQAVSKFTAGILWIRYYYYYHFKV